MTAAIDLAVRAMVLLSLAALVTAALHRRPASLAAMVWTLALGGLLLLPAFALVTPPWRVEVLPARADAAVAAPLSAPLSAPLPDPRAGQPEPDAPARREMLAAAGDRATARRGVNQRLESRRADADVAVATAATVGTVTTAPLASPPDWRVAAAALVLFVSIALLARIALSHVRMSGIAASAAPAGAAWTTLADEVRAAMGIARHVPVRISAAIGVPAIVGLFRPVLLVPVDADEWDADTRRAVVLHELAHVARRDALAQLVSQVACAIYWCLPLVWHGARRAAALRERASDDHVLRAGVRASAYAESLIVLARVARGGDMQAAALSMARPSRMRERVVAILDPRVRRDAPARATIGAMTAATLCAVAALAAIQPAAAAAINPAPSEPGVTVVASAESPASPESPATSRTPASPESAATWAAPASPDAPASSDAPVSSDPAAIPALLVPPVPTVPLASLALPASQSPFCGGDLDSASTSISSEDDGSRKMKISMSGGGCKVDLRTEGRIEFTPDFTDISSVGPRGFFRLDVTENGTRRELDITQSGGSLAREWRVNGRAQAWDADARAWFAAFLIALDRRTAIGVDVRLPHLMRQGGVDAVLRETALLTGDHARNTYYTRLAKSTSLSTPQITRILDQAAQLTKSDHYAHALIEAFAGNGVADDAQRTAIAKMIDTMESDHYRAESVEALVGGPPVSAGAVDFLVRMIPKMESDHYQLQVLSKVMQKGRLTPAQQAALTDVSASIESDHYAAEFLKILANAGPMAPAVRQSFMSAAARIDSDHYAAEVAKTLIAKQGSSSTNVPDLLQLAQAMDSDHYKQDVIATLLQRWTLTEGDMLGVVRVARGMSDHYASETLRRVAQGTMSQAVRAAVLDAAAGLSSHYAEQVRRAAGQR